MKTTLEIDEDLVRRIMNLTGIATKTEAIDFALVTAEKVIARKNLLADPPDGDDLADCIDAAYNLDDTRLADVPH